MYLVHYFIEFVIGSFLGWCWESVYCSGRSGKWEDRGFLFGPVCPIYGAGFLLITLIFTEISPLADRELPAWLVFLICMAGSAVLEYTTSWVLETRFHARWWDYSDLPLNLNGRICLFCSLGFGLAGLAVQRFFLPFYTGMIDRIPFWICELISLAFAFALGIDWALTEASLSDLLKNMQHFHEEMNQQAETVYTRVAAAPQAVMERMADTGERAVQAAGAIRDGDWIRRLSRGQRGVLHRIQSFRPRLSLPYMSVGQGLKKEMAAYEQRRKWERAQKRLEKKLRRQGRSEKKI